MFVFFIEQLSLLQKTIYRKVLFFLGAVKNITCSYKESGATVAHNASLEAIFREVTSLPAPKNRDYF